jgi:hypothetical protein
MNREVKLLPTDVQEIGGKELDGGIGKLLHG